MQPANKGRRYPAEPLTDDEFWTLLGAIKGNRPLAARNRALLGVLWGSGVRISEALGLMPRDVDGISLHVGHGKGDKARIAGLRPEAEALLSSWLEVRGRLGLNGRQPVFCSVSDGSRGAGVRQPGQKLDPSYVRHLLPKLAERAGIDKRVHPHGLRHSHATRLVKGGATLHEIAGQLGHQSTATTDTYLAKIAPAQRLEALRRAWGNPSQSAERPDDQSG